MSVTIVIARIIGPVLLLRAISMLIDREHFVRMLDGLEREVATVSFSMFPIALLMTCIAVLLLHDDRSTLAAILIELIAWGGVLKASALILFPRLVVLKAQRLGKAGFVTVVAVVTMVTGAYFSWFGYFSRY